MNRKEFIKKYRQKTYIGDGLSACFDGYHFILSTERDNGIHWVGLEPNVFDALIEYRKRLYEEAEQIELDEK